jgi:hypothetical protein
MLTNELPLNMAVARKIDFIRTSGVISSHLGLATQSNNQATKRWSWPRENAPLYALENFFILLRV